MQVDSQCFFSQHLFYTRIRYLATIPTRGRGGDLNGRTSYMARRAMGTTGGALGIAREVPQPIASNKYSFWVSKTQNYARGTIVRRRRKVQPTATTDPTQCTQMETYVPWSQPRECKRTRIREPRQSRHSNHLHNIWQKTTARTTTTCINAQHSARTPERGRATRDMARRAMGITGRSSGHRLSLD